MVHDIIPIGLNDDLWVEPLHKRILWRLHMWLFRTQKRFMPGRMFYNIVGSIRYKVLQQVHK